MSEADGAIVIEQYAANHTSGMIKAKSREVEGNHNVSGAQTRIRYTDGDRLLLPDERCTDKVLLARF